MITSPTLSLNRESNEKSCSKAEFVALLEAKHLHECEESDYLMLSKLFQNRDSVNDSDDAFGDVCHHFIMLYLFCFVCVLRVLPIKINPKSYQMIFRVAVKF